MENKKIDLPKIIFLMGPTASGKTKLAIELYKVMPVELISVDSALIYKYMDIGTAKPSIEILNKIPHRLLNIIDPSQTYSAANFYKDVLIEISKIIAIDRIPLLVGGTMFYYKVLLDGLSELPSTNLTIRSKINLQIKEQGCNVLHEQLKNIDPVAAAKIHPNDSQRISRALEVFYTSGKTLTEFISSPRKNLPYQVYQFGIIQNNMETLYDRISKRFYKMLSLGFEEEVKSLFKRGDLHEDMPSMRCVGYRQMWSFLQGRITHDEMIYQCITATKRLAKKQITWLRKWNGIRWLDGEKPEQAIKELFKIF